MPKTDTDKSGSEAQLMQALPYIAVVVCLGLAAGAYLYLFRPMLGVMMPGGELDLEPLTNRLNEDTAYLKKAEASVQSYREVALDAKQKVSLVLPSEEDVPGLFVQLEEITLRNHMVAGSVNIVKPVAATGAKSGGVSLPKAVKKVTVTMNAMGGTAADFQRLLEALEKLVRVADVRQLSFGGSPSYGITMDVYMLDSASVVQVEPKAAPAADSSATAAAGTAGTE